METFSQFWECLLAILALQCEPGQAQGLRGEFSGTSWWTAVQVRKGRPLLAFLKCPQSMQCLDWQVSLDT